MHVPRGAIRAPKPLIPILPLLEGAALLGSPRTALPGVLSVGSPLLVTRGASAIRLALRTIGVTPGEEVLVPAFNCPSMVQPIRAEGAQPVFYGIASDLRITVGHIERHLGARTRAMLVPHLLNRIQDLRPIRTLCDAKHIILIEDCAHALFGTINGTPVGSIGHFAIASPRKFLPLEEGGALTSATDNLASVGKRVPARDRSMRLAFDALDRAVAHRRLRAIKPAIHLIKSAGHGIRGLQDSGRHPSTATGGARLNPAGSADGPVLRASSITQWLIPRLVSQDLVRKRRENYSLLVDSLAGCPALRVAFDDLPKDAVPYMVPVLLDDPERQFRLLNEKGVPMWRWEHSTFGICPVTDQLAHALIQIPCHQSLRAAELEWMSDTLRSVGGSR